MTIRLKMMRSAKMMTLAVQSQAKRAKRAKRARKQRNQKKAKEVIAAHLLIERQSKFSAKHE